MNTSRSESRKRERSRRRKRQGKIAIGLLAAAAVCVTGALVWKLNTASTPMRVDKEDDAAGPVAVASAPAQSSSPAQAAPLASPEPKPATSVQEQSAYAASAQTGSLTGSEGMLPEAGRKQDGSGVVKLAFVGDVLFASTVETQLKQNGWDYPYREVRTYLERPDLTVANLETPVSKRGTALQKKEYTYRSSPQALPAFAQAGFDVVNLANNHILDYGADALLDTLKHLDQAGIRHVGAGLDTDEAFRAEIIERKGVKVAFLGLSRVVPDFSWYAGKGKPGVAGTYDHLLSQVKKSIEDARSKADLVVVLVHWGIERKDMPEKYQRDLAHMYIDAGADLVVGSHPHVLQGLESYKGRWIAYSLGNFLFTTNETAATWETIILEAACSKDRRCELNAVPISNKYAKPEVMSEQQGQKLFDRLTRISFTARVDSAGRISAESSIR